MSKGPSLTALLGLLAVAGYQNRDKIAEWFGNSSTTGRPSDRPSGLDKLLPQNGGGNLGTMLQDGLADLMDRFKQTGHPEADSWVANGPNTAIGGPDLEHAIGSDTLNQLEQQTGLSKAEILQRLQRDLPGAVDQWTPNGLSPARV